MGQTAERAKRHFVADFVGHARTPIYLLKTVRMNPSLVGTDPLLVHEGEAFLHILDFGQPRGIAKEGYLNPVFEEKTCISLWGRITDQLEGHVGGRDLTQVLGDGNKSPELMSRDGKNLNLGQLIHEANPIPIHPKVQPPLDESHTKS